jgi:hypothetical protein
VARGQQGDGDGDGDRQRQAEARGHRVSRRSHVAGAELVRHPRAAAHIDFRSIDRIVSVRSNIK